MSVQVDISAKRRRESRMRALVLLAVIAVVLVVMAFDTKVVEIGSKEDSRPNAFSAQTFGKKNFPKIQSEIEKAAVDAEVLAAAIAEDKAAAGEQYGKPGSVGPIFPVKFSGVISGGKGSIYTVSVEGMPEGMNIRIQVGPAINGTEVRDATGTIEFGQFTNQIEYQDVGAALNDEIKEQVLADLDRDNLIGKKVDVVGVFQLINPAGWLVTPVRLKSAPL